MRKHATGVGSILLVVGLAGCPAIVGLDGNYTAGGGGGGGGPDGAPRTDGGRTDAHEPGSGTGSGHHDGGRGGHDAGTSADTGGGSDAHGQTDTGATCATACSLAAPQGWTLVAFEASKADSCPAGFTDTKVIEPSGSGSCSCGNCTITSQPNCVTGLITSTWSGPTCELAGGTFQTNNGACVVGALGNADYSSWTAPAPAAGACTSSPTATNPTSTEEHFCTPETCAATACESALPGGFSTCLYQTGDQSCPATATHKHTVGATASASCGTCSCTATATSCSGMVNVYNDTTGCAGSPYVSFNANGGCYAWAGIIDMASYTYTATPDGVSCNAGDSTATLDLTGPGTVCCP